MSKTSQSENSNKKKLVKNARAIISNQIAMPLGAVKMNKIIYWAKADGTFANIDLKVFNEYTDNFNGSPVGTERLLWSSEALMEQDRALDQVTSKYKDAIIDKCFEIIEKFAGDLPELVDQ
ncbi:MAG: hypothetical protein ABW174_00945 [Flavitalea sp.]